MNWTWMSKNTTIWLDTKLMVFWQFKNWMSSLEFTFFPWDDLITFFYYSQTTAKALSVSSSSLLFSENHFLKKDPYVEGLSCTLWETKLWVKFICYVTLMKLVQLTTKYLLMALQLCLVPAGTKKLSEGCSQQRWLWEVPQGWDLTLNQICVWKLNFAFRNINEDNAK